MQEKTGEVAYKTKNTCKNTQKQRKMQEILDTKSYISIQYVEIKKKTSGGKP